MLQSYPSKELWPGGDKLQTQLCTPAPPPTQVHEAMVVSQAYHRPGRGPGGGGVDRGTEADLLLQGPGATGRAGDMSHSRPCAKAAAPPPAGCLGEVPPIHIPGLRSVRVEQLLPPGLVCGPEGTCRPSRSSEPRRTLQTCVHTCQGRQRGGREAPPAPKRVPEGSWKRWCLGWNLKDGEGLHFSPSPPNRQPPPSPLRARHCYQLPLPRLL